MRKRTIAVMAAVALAFGAGAPPTMGGADRVCVADYVNGDLRCKQEPRRMEAMVPGIIRSIEWQFGGPGPQVIGFGRVWAPGFCCGYERARIKVERLETCGRDLWWKLLTVKYGPGYDAALVRDVKLPSPCDGTRRDR